MKIHIHAYDVKKPHYLYQSQIIEIEIPASGNISLSKVMNAVYKAIGEVKEKMRIAEPA